MTGVRIDGGTELPGRLDEGSSPVLARSGEVTVFLVLAGDDGRSGRRAPVVTIDAAGLIALPPPPAGWHWLVDSGLGSELEEATLESDDALVRAAAVRTIEQLGDLLQRASAPPAERVV